MQYPLNIIYKILKDRNLLVQMIFKIMIKFNLKGDKSLSHRYLILSSLSRSNCRIKNLAMGQDVLSTKKILEKLGMEFETREETLITDNSEAYSINPDVPLNCGNSGTTMRVLAGVLAAKNINCILIGDTSLSRRPMGRIINPLEKLGAKIFSNNDKAPLKIFDSQIELKENFIELDKPSAQVKSSLLFFSLISGIHLKLNGRIDSRDHTELSFKNLGANITIHQNHIELLPSNNLNSFEVNIPGDISSAMFLIVFAILKENSHLYLEHVLINPTRSKSLEILKKMGADITLHHQTNELGEQVADIEVKYTENLKNLDLISKDDLPFIIDEIPILSLLFSKASGLVTIENPEELRLKESDRLESILQMIPSSKLEKSNLVIKGDNLLNVRSIQSEDHRILLTEKIYQLINENFKITKEEKEIISISFPEFFDFLEKLMKKEA